jgi:hypothetical protein
MVRYLEQRSVTMNAVERDKLAFWFAQAGMWGRFTEVFDEKFAHGTCFVDGSAIAFHGLLQSAIAAIGDSILPVQKEEG